MNRLLVSVLALFIVVLSTDAGAQQSKPNAGVKIYVKDATIAVSTTNDDILGTAKAMTLGQKYSSILSLEGKQRLQFKFKIVDDKGEAVIVHQAFVIFIYKSTKQEVAYVAEFDVPTKTYVFDLNLKTHAKEFAGLSGQYEAYLILGDAAVTNPVNWHFADVNLKLAPVKVAEVPKSKRIDYTTKPEITHVFRAPEARPPNFAADVFAVLCAAPLVLVVLAWFRIGINFDNFPISLSPLGFHAGLISVFGLYFMFWLHLNMFTTLKYLGGILIPTYFFGQRLFNSLAAQRKL